MLQMTVASFDPKVGGVLWVHPGLKIGPITLVPDKAPGPQNQCPPAGLQNSVSLLTQVRKVYFT